MGIRASAMQGSKPAQNKDQGYTASHVLQYTNPASLAQLFGLGLKDLRVEGSGGFESVVP